MRSPEGGPRLAELQRRFFALVVAADGVTPALRRAALSEGDLDALVVGDERRDAVGRLEIYAGMYFHRLLDVLGADYPKLAAVIGQSAFTRLVRDFLDACPSQHPSLRHLGARLPAFVERHLLSDERPWLADLASLEWARVTVFDAPDAPTRTLEGVRGLAPEAFPELPLPLIPAHQIVVVGSRVEEVWRRIEAGQAPGAPSTGRGRLIVWRQDFIVYHRVVDVAEVPALELAAAGATFGALCESLAPGRQPEDAARLAWETVSRWLLAGLVTA